MRLYIAPNNTPEERLLRKNSECASRRGHGIKHGKVLPIMSPIIDRPGEFLYTYRLVAGTPFRRLCERPLEVLGGPCRRKLLHSPVYKCVIAMVLRRLVLRPIMQHYWTYIKCERRGGLVHYIRYKRRHTSGQSRDNGGEPAGYRAGKTGCPGANDACEHAAQGSYRRRVRGVRSRAGGPQTTGKQAKIALSRFRRIPRRHVL